MQAHSELIKHSLKCSEDQARKVETYITQGNMINWASASKQLINTIARAVNNKLLRDVTTPAAPKGAPTAEKQTSPKKAPNAPKAGTKIAHAMKIYEAMVVDGVRASRKDTIMAIANSMQITPQAAAGYYQNCKKKAG
jgi:hypothetical protein